jgi:hypothetical protein
VGVPSLGGVRDQLAGGRVEPGDPGSLPGAVPLDELGGVPRTRGRLREPVRRVERVEVLVDRERITLVDDGRIDQAGEQDSLPGVGSHESRPVDLWELNEAFASQALYCRDRLGIDPEKYNVNGAAIAIGHPYGMSGARMVGHALLEGRRRADATWS